MLLIIIIIIGSALSGNKRSEKDICIDLYLHLTNTTEVVNTYKNDIKSSTLRGNSSSLSTLLYNTSKKLEDYFAEYYQIDNISKSISKATLEESTAIKDNAISELFEAKITGSLDRIFAHKMAYEIELISSEENSIIDSTKNDSLKAILEESYESLDSIYGEFNDFSETK